MKKKAVAFCAVCAIVSQATSVFAFSPPPKFDIPREISGQIKGSNFGKVPENQGAFLVEKTELNYSNNEASNISENDAISSISIESGQLITYGKHSVKINNGDLESAMVTGAGIFEQSENWTVIAIHNRGRSGHFSFVKSMKIDDNVKIGDTNYKLISKNNVNIDNYSDYISTQKTTLSEDRKSYVILLTCVENQPNLRILAILQTLSIESGFNRV